MPKKQEKSGNELTPEFLQLVTERPDPTLTRSSKFCPHCESTNITEGDEWETLVGGERDGVDVNHHWVRTHCNDCGKDFTKEFKVHNVWYTDPETKKILRGIPSCYESYVYTCKHCGGDVLRDYTALDGSPTRIISISYKEGCKPVKNYKIFFECESCHTKVESSEEYMSL